MFPYVENKHKFVKGGNLKRSNYAEAISQIEAALSGEDPSPISTQAENGNSISTDKSTTAVPDEAPADSKTEASKTTAKPQPPPPQKTEAASKGKRTRPAPAAKAKESRVTPAQAKNKSAVGKADDGADPPPLQPPVVGEATSTTTTITTINVEAFAGSDDVTGQIPPEGAADSTESPTSRSGRKIKPKK